MEFANNFTNDSAVTANFTEGSGGGFEGDLLVEAEENYELPASADIMSLHDEDEYPDSWFYGYVAATVVLFLAFALVLTFMSSLLLSKKVRQNAFDLYVLMIILPDALIVGELAVVTAQKVALGKDIPEDPLVTDRAQPFHDFVHYFYYAANFYLNAIIIHEIFQMIQSAQAMKRYTPPSSQKVLFQTLGVYTVSGLYSLWWVLDVPWAATHRDPQNGRIAGPGSEVFPEMVVTILHIILMTLPVLYIFGVFIYIYFRKLLKPTGRTRQLYLYFMRIIVAYVLFYIPGIFINYFEENLSTDDLEFYAGLLMDFMFPLQTIVTVGLALTKEDIRAAWNDFWSCRCGLDDDQGDIYALDYSVRRSAMGRANRVSEMVGSTTSAVANKVRQLRWSTTTTSAVRSSTMDGTSIAEVVGTTTASVVEGGGVARRSSVMQDGTTDMEAGTSTEVGTA